MEGVGGAETQSRTKLQVRLTKEGHHKSGEGKRAQSTPGIPDTGDPHREDESLYHLALKTSGA